MFNCKGHPFAALVSADLPTLVSLLVDYNLVRKLDLKLTDIQFRKFYFIDKKMWILGRASKAVQFILQISGYFCVNNLYHLFHSNCVAGTKRLDMVTRLGLKNKGLRNPVYKVEPFEKCVLVNRDINGSGHSFGSQKNLFIILF